MFTFPVSFLPSPFSGKPEICNQNEHRVHARLLGRVVLAYPVIFAKFPPLITFI